MTDNHRQVDPPMDTTALPPLPHRHLAGEFLGRWSAANRAVPPKTCRSTVPPDTLAWGRQYLAAHFAKPSSSMHEWLNQELADFQRRGRKLNLIGPRGGAKSTIGTLCYVLLVAVERREPYIWIVSDTKQQAQTHLENVKAELVDNPELARDYPHATGRGPRWQAT